MRNNEFEDWWGKEGKVVCRWSENKPLAKTIWGFSQKSAQERIKELQSDITSWVERDFSNQCRIKELEAVIARTRNLMEVEELGAAYNCLEDALKDTK